MNPTDQIALAAQRAELEELLSNVGYREAAVAVAKQIHLDTAQRYQKAIQQLHAESSDAQTRTHRALLEAQEDVRCTKRLERRIAELDAMLAPQTTTTEEHR